MIGFPAFHSPDFPAGNHSGIWIQQNIVLAEQLPFLGIVRAADPVSVFKLFNVQAKDNHRVHIADFIRLWKRKNGIRFFFSSMKQQKFASGSLPGMDGKIHAAG